MGIVPLARPRIGLEEMIKLVPDAERDRVCLLGLRGYYLNSMGVRGKNDRGIYDDAIAVYAPDRFVAFNANTDPSAHRKRIATLIPGKWKYKIGIHGLNRPKERQYKALVQAAEVVVSRDGSEIWERGFFGINIHRGGYNTTSSLGCQTVAPGQWQEFIDLVETKMAICKQSVVTYVLREAW